MWKLSVQRRRLHFMEIKTILFPCFWCLWYVLVQVMDRNVEVMRLEQKLQQSERLCQNLKSKLILQNKNMKAEKTQNAECDVEHQKMEHKQQGWLHWDGCDARMVWTKQTVSKIFHFVIYLSCPALHPDLVNTSGQCCRPGCCTLLGPPEVGIVLRHILGNALYDFCHFWKKLYWSQHIILHVVILRRAIAWWRWYIISDTTKGGAVSTIHVHCGNRYYNSWIVVCLCVFLFVARLLREFWADSFHPDLLHWINMTTISA